MQKTRYPKIRSIGTSTTKHPHRFNRFGMFKSSQIRIGIGDCPGYDVKFAIIRDEIEFGQGLENRGNTKSFGFLLASESFDKFQYKQTIVDNFGIISPKFGKGLFATIR